MNDPMVYKKCSFATCGVAVITLLPMICTTYLHGQFFTTMYEIFSFVGVMYMIRKDMTEIYETT